MKSKKQKNTSNQILSITQNEMIFSKYISNKKKTFSKISNSVKMNQIKLKKIKNIKKKGNQKTKIKYNIIK